MIKLNIQKVAKEKGITSSYQLMKLLAVPPGTAARLWRGEMRMIHLNTLDMLCLAFNCEPNDLLEIQKPPAGQTKRATA